MQCITLAALLIFVCPGPNNVLQLVVQTYYLFECGTHESVDKNGGTLYYFKLGLKQSYFPHNINKFKNFVIVNIDLKLARIIYQNIYFLYFTLLFSLSLSQYMLKNNKRTHSYLVVDIWNKGNCNTACGQVTRNRFELTPKFIILLIYRNLLKPWPELDARLGLAAGFINNCNRLTRALSINGISFENLFRYLSLAVEQFRDRNLSITSLFVRFG